MYTTARATERLHMTRIRSNLVFTSSSPGAPEALGLDRQDVVRRGLIGFRQVARQQSSSFK
jgi:hypothetical protein